jgi:di/tricarboxylate transporter
VLLIWFVIPVPQGVAANAWHLLALFVATIAAIIGKAMPIGALSILAMALVALTGVTSDKPAVAIADAPLRTVLRVGVEAERDGTHDRVHDRAPRAVLPGVTGAIVSSDSASA